MLRHTPMCAIAVGGDGPHLEQFSAGAGEEREFAILAAFGSRLVRLAAVPIHVEARGASISGVIEIRNACIHRATNG